MVDYTTYTDEQLIRELRSGKKEIIDFVMDKYKDLVRREANAMFLLGGENEDLIQEGMIGLFKAIRDYDLEKPASFYSFAGLCVRRQMYSAVKASNRKKHSPLNTYVSVYEKPERGKEKSVQIIDMIEAGEETNPETAFFHKEHFEKLEQELDETLSDLERRVLYLHLRGEDYKTIALLLGRKPKTIDNALQRIKGKVTALIERTTD